MLQKTLLASVLIYSIFLSLFAPFAASAQQFTLLSLNQTNNTGLKFHLSNGEKGAENRVVKPQVKTKSLSGKDTANLLNRIPSPNEESTDKLDFAKRAGSLPAPKAGKKIEVKFPAESQISPPNVSDTKKTLEIIRFSPDGDVPLAPDLSVTFSQPMVAVTSQTQAAQIVPVELTPKTEGKWRWLGTKTLMFDTTKRFPMATKFTARIPAGTKSANGETLKKDFVWTFTTPSPTVVQSLPNVPYSKRDALMFISFDQEINPNAVIEKIKVRSGKKRLNIRLATQAEIDADSSVSYYAKDAQPNRWLAFRAVNADSSTENALPASSEVFIMLEKGMTSIEGPIGTKEDEDWSFNTFPAMKFTGNWCGSNNNCKPDNAWRIQFTTTIDAAAFKREMVKIEPPIDGMNIYPSGESIIITGFKKGRTTYKVSVDNSLKDIFGQNLEGEATATFNVGKAQIGLYSQGGSFVVLDPTAKPSYSIYSINHEEVKLKIYRVEPQDWEAFRQF
jgi:alpha-2-macroglobulin